MVWRAIGSIRSYFSVFKNKFKPLEQQHYESLGQMYTELCDFEASLEDLQVKKMDKKLLDLEKKFKRLVKNNKDEMYRIPIEINHTYEYFVKMTDKLTFGTE